MKIRERGYVMVEAGPFLGFMDLPMDARRSRGMSTTCDGCHVDITTARFIGAFRTRGKNLKLCAACGVEAGAPTENVQACR